MKVFITIEVDPKEGVVMPESVYINMMKLVDDLRQEGIPVQYKTTNLPRRKRGWTKASELHDIES